MEGLMVKGRAGLSENKRQGTYQFAQKGVLAFNDD
jgi:hypothetical protein